MKKACARKAFELIQSGMVIGLGGGATVALLIRELEKGGKNVTAVTPSGDTAELCLKARIPVLPLEFVSATDLAFDGCDEMDRDLNALKSCGGIHTREKLAAAMAKDYILLLDETKLTEKLTFRLPVTVEALPSARSYVKARLAELGAAVTERRGDKKAGLVISDDGNYLFEAAFLGKPDPRGLSQALDQMPGVVGHSLFCGLVSKAVVAGQDRIEVIERQIKG